MFLHQQHWSIQDKKKTPEATPAILRSLHVGIIHDVIGFTMSNILQLWH